MSKLQEGISKDEVKLLKQIEWRSQFYALVYSYSRLCANSIPYALYPYINWLYPNPEDKEKKVAALKRGLAYWNMTPSFSPFCFALFASMEKEAKENPNFDVSTINAIKASIQGPLAGIGDSIFWVTWRIIVTGIALQFSLQGSIIGPILFILLYNSLNYATRHFGLYIGYKMGTNFLSKAYESGLIQVITKTAAIIGLIMVGGMAASQVSIPIALTYSLNGAEQSIYDIFNSILPGLLELMFTLGVLKLVKKKVNIIYIILAVFAFCILGAMVGLF